MTTPHKRSTLKIHFASKMVDKVSYSDTKSLVDPASKGSILKPKSKKYSPDDFEVHALLGYGTFGSVLLVKYLNSEETQVFALKSIVKSKIKIDSKQIEHIKNERDVLYKLKD